MSYSGIGGQAVMEGVMMKNGKDYAVAVRLSDGTIHIDKKQMKTDGTKVNRIPIVRGIYAFGSSLVIGLSTLMDSASYFEEEDEIQIINSYEHLVRNVPDEAREGEEDDLNNETEIKDVTITIDGQSAFDYDLGELA